MRSWQLLALLIRWSQVRIPHGLPRIQKEAHEFRFVGFFVSGRSLVAEKSVLRPSLPNGKLPRHHDLRGEARPEVSASAAPAMPRLRDQ
jgi:hypothetical protein